MTSSRERGCDSVTTGPKRSLRTRIALTLTVVVAIYAALDHLVQRWAVLPRFAELEEREAREDLDRVLRAVHGEIARLEQRCRELADWSETRRLLAERAAPPAPGGEATLARFVRSMLAPAELARAGLDLCYVIDRHGTVLAGGAFDRRSGEPLKLRAFELDRVAPTHPFLVQEKLGADGQELPPDPARGLSMTEIGPTLLSALPITPADGDPTWLGTVVVGRRFDADLVDAIENGTAVDFDVWNVTDASLPADVAAALERVTTEASAVLEVRDERHLAAWTVIEDARRIPTLLVRANLPRSISAFGSDAVEYGLVSTVAAGTLLVFVLLAVLRRVVLAPLARLTNHAVAIGRTDDTSAKLRLARDDEIGVLSREFDRMMEKLEQSRAEVVRTARVAGMSEISTGVLHNVGNALNSVNVTVSLMSERMRETKLAKLERVVEMLESQGERLGEFITNHPKGKHVAPFLFEVTKLMRHEHEELAAEARKLGAGVEHLRALVASQQEFAGKNELREAVRIDEQVAHAATFGDLQRAIEAGLVLAVADAGVGRVMLDRHKLLQILVNLLKNAGEAIAEAGRRPGRIDVGIARDGERLRITVEDDGCGIAATDLGRIFQHGFTTKPGGHGFGLHSSANAAVEMGGRIEATSDGPGLGARFVLDLPFEPAPQA